MFLPGIANGSSVAARPHRKARRSPIITKSSLILWIQQRKNITDDCDHSQNRQRARGKANGHVPSLHADSLITNSKPPVVARLTDQRSWLTHKSEISQLPLRMNTDANDTMLTTHYANDTGLMVTKILAFCTSPRGTRRCGTKCRL
jgi:hypothetical protein